MNLNNKISIITGLINFFFYYQFSFNSIVKKGASSGIGRATAVLFSKLGSSLVLIGRSEEALNETITSCQPETSVRFNMFYYCNQSLFDQEFKILC